MPARRYSYCCYTLFQLVPAQGSLYVMNNNEHTVSRNLKIDAEIRNAFSTFVCDTASPQTGRLLLKTGRQNQKVSPGDVEGFF